MQLSDTRIIISGGGTGGHIYPAIAIAQALEEQLPGVRFLFVGARGKMEMEKVPAAGYEIKGLWISGLERKISLRNLLFPIKLISSIIKARRIISRFRPHAVVGVGGFASGPTLYAASARGIPTLIQEQNAFPGITNKWLAKKVDRICVAHEKMDKYFPAGKIVKTGNPVRGKVIQIHGKRAGASEFFGLDPDKKTVLVIGGSQGARSINLAILGMLDYFMEKDIQLIWQTGRAGYEAAREAFKALSTGNVRVYEFIYEMDLAYAMADIVVSRAGAIAMAEICAVGKPAIYIPLPTAAEDHQTKNAMALESKKAAIIVRDAEAKEKLRPAIAWLMNDEQKRQSMARAAIGFAITDGDKKIANEIIKLIKEKNDRS